jgi:4-aminobutyrate aminotransferase/(S)-3-amino-2-methylpropionate transaminase
MLAASGADAVTAALKTARLASGRPGIVAFEGAYHGRTLMTLSLTSKYAFKKTFGPFAPEIYRAPFPAAYRMGTSEGEAVERCWEAFERLLVAHVGPEAIAAVIVEPVQGEGGFIPTPPEFMRRLRAFCTRSGSALIADEVQCGFGRTGSLFAIEQMGVEPDIVVSAKSLAAGLPLSATSGRAALMDAAHVGGIGGTYGGNPLACVAAIEVLNMVERGDLLARARAIGQTFCERALAWKQEFPLIGDVRGMGAMMAIELVRDRATREPAADEVLALVERCARRGLLTMRAGLYANCLRLLMPLVITDDQLQEGLDVLEDGLRAVNG